ncbi:MULTISPECIES: nucleoside triphosphate pyrophosphatase [unclassified Sphingomonas]|uniref:Maf family protein n=1 Tax=unclassified Sphingomonas TaxID=196159 RepID=UPI000BD49312|nr:MAG: septum formation protein Maf [Sphingomonas sp. 32-62-10]
MTLILASQSASRRAMLDAAGVAYTALPAHVDEAGVKTSLLAAHHSPRDIADALAEVKAIKISQAHPAALVLGSDSIVARADGVLLDKPADRETAQQHLASLSGGTHHLISAAVVAEQGRPVWRHVDQARLVVRSLSPAFIEAYLDDEWPAIAQCVGCFRIEGRGVTLFDRIEGNHFTILGMPLLPVLGYLRQRGTMAS